MFNLIVYLVSYVKYLLCIHNNWGTIQIIWLLQLFFSFFFLLLLYFVKNSILFRWKIVFFDRNSIFDKILFYMSNTWSSSAHAQKNTCVLPVWKVWKMRRSRVAQREITLSITAKLPSKKLTRKAKSKTEILFFFK